MGIPIILMAFAIIGCSQDPQIITSEVTREIPVTVETVQTVEVTKEVPVTVETTRQVEVTRIAEITREIPVTVEVPVTRLVEVEATEQPLVTAVAPTATPIPDATSTPEPASTIEAPTPTPTVSTAATSTPDSLKTFGDWRMRSEPVTFGPVAVVHFENIARKWEAGADAPVLVYECDSKRQRAMYVDWNFALTTEISRVPRYTEDPFKQYRDDDLDALAALADQLLAFIEQIQIRQVDIGKLEQTWKSLRTHQNLDPDKAAELVERMRERNHRSVLIAAEFYSHRQDHPAAQKYGPTYVDEITEDWIVLPGHRAQMGAGDLGRLKRMYRDIERSVPLGSQFDRLMVATVKQPEQLDTIMAEWEITGLNFVMNHCSSIQISRP